MSGVYTVQGRPIVPVILVGGDGKRLWPLSRKAKPKPFLKFDFLKGGETLLQETLWRTRLIEVDWTQKHSEVDGFIRTIIIGNRNHVKHISKNTWMHPLSGDLTVLLEPEAKGTALAIACAVREIQENIAKDAIAIVMPSDHYIDDHIVLANALELAILEAAQGKIVTLGVDPAGEPNPHYGYIVPHEDHTPSGYASPIMLFEEKPGVTKAKELLTHRAYWNSGIFVFSTDTFFEQLQIYASGISLVSASIYKNKWPVFGGISLDHYGISYGSYWPDSEGDSIDRVLMQHTTEGVVVPLGNCGWTDLGTWDAITEVKARQRYNLKENYHKGDVQFANTQGSYVHSNTKRLIILENMRDCVVVDTDDILYVGERGPDIFKYVEEKERLE